MSTAEDTLEVRDLPKSRTIPIIDRVLGFLSSVRFGVSLLCILVVLSMIGMLIIQQNVVGFDAYYASLTPAERFVYGKLGFFDIYYSWYFNLLLLVLSLNIILSSIDHFPAAWKYISSPKTTATKEWLAEQRQHKQLTIDAASHEDAAEKVRKEFAANGLKAQTNTQTILEYGLNDDGTKNFADVKERKQTVVFGERGSINRLGAYLVHLALLTLFLGHLIANQTGFDAVVRMFPGETTDQIQMIEYDLDQKMMYNVQLPFSMTCTDIQQRLIDPSGSISTANTMDWRTQMRVDDPEYGSFIADISLNMPFNYRGYRFFQAQTSSIGNARTATLALKSSETGETQEISMKRLGSTELPDGTLVEWVEFLPDFFFNGDKPDTRSGDYNNPVVVLNVTPPNAERVRVYAFAADLGDAAPVSAPKAGYQWHLKEYEKAPLAHELSIKYDPYSGAFIAWYFGGFGLIGALAFVFFISHKRVWAVVEPDENGKYSIVLGGNTNRNHVGFEENFTKIASDLSPEEPTDDAADSAI